MSFFNILLANKKDPVVISHGTYALKEASLLDKQLAKKSKVFLLKNINFLNQWEAKENLLRILLIDKWGLKSSLKDIAIVESLLSDKSSIVCAYAIEFLVRYKYENQCETLLQTVNFGLSHEKAAVKARTKKLLKELNLNNSIDS